MCQQISRAEGLQVCNGMARDSLRGRERTAAKTRSEWGVLQQEDEFAPTDEPRAALVRRQVCVAMHHTVYTSRRDMRLQRAHTGVCTTRWEHGD